MNWAVEEGVDIICMSWAIDKEDDDDDKRVQPLDEAIREAAKNTLLFCANPDKGANDTKNETYPRLMDQTRTFCIGAGSEDGKKWHRIHDDDHSCDFIFPGVGLDIQVENNFPRDGPNRSRAGPPVEWQKFDGSSLACALAARLAAMILHCGSASGARNNAKDKRRVLKSHDGMRKAFNHISKEKKWLPVRNFFGQCEAYRIAFTEEKKKWLEEVIVNKL